MTPHPLPKKGSVPFFSPSPPRDPVPVRAVLYRVAAACHVFQGGGRGARPERAKRRGSAKGLFSSPRR